MIQVIPTRLIGNYGAGNSIAPIWGNSPNTPTNDHLISIPWPADGTIRNLLVTDDVDGAVWTLYINDVATALTATSASGVAACIGVDVAVVEEDRVYYYRTGAARLAASNLPLNASIEFESGDTVTSVYGTHCDPSKGSAGAFGAQGPSGPPPSATISLAPMDGTLVRLVALADFDRINLADGLRWTVYKTPAGTTTPVAQDGSGGTVDTVIDIAASALGPVASTKTFTLPFVEGDLLEVYMEATGTTGLHHTAGFGVAVEAATAGEFMICGSMQTGQDNFTATTAYGSVPANWDVVENGNGGSVNRGTVTSFDLTGLQAWNSGTGYPVAADPVTLALRKNAAAPANQPTITMNDNDIWVVDSDVAHVVQIDYGDTWSTESTIATTFGVQAHWSYRATVSTAPPTPPVTTTYATRRLRQFSLPISETNKWLFIRKLEFLLETGVALSAGQGSDPQIMIQLSRDWGHTWGTERWISAGRRGQYARRAILRNCGRVRSGGVVRLVVSDPIAWVFLDCLAEIEEGSS